MRACLFPQHRSRVAWLNGLLCGSAGVYLTLSFSPTWADGVVAGPPWTALTLVIFANWNPDTIVFGAIHLGPEKSVIDLDLRLGCGRCVQVCREGALSFVFDPEVDFVNNLIGEVEAVTDIT